MKFLSLVVAAMLLPLQALALQFGVLAPTGSEDARQAWSGLIEYLEDETGLDIELVPLPANAGIDAFALREIDVLLGNPVQSAILSDVMSANLMASVSRPHGDVFGGLIVVRADSDIRSISDLEGTRIATLRHWAAGGFIFQAAYLTSMGFDMETSPGVHIIGVNQVVLVDMVMAGEADAAFIRTGLLERLVREGRIEADDLRVLDEVRYSSIGLTHTTPLYPEWFVVGQRSLDPAVSTELTLALRNLREGHAAAEQAGIVGFIAPLDVTPVVEAMRLIGVPPYDS